METVYTKAAEHQLAKGTLLTTLPTLGKEWRVTHDFKPTEYLTTWTNSIQLTIGGFNGQYGDRIAFIHPSSPKLGKMVIVSAVNGEKSYSKSTAQPTVGAWTTITISQTLEGGKYMFRITIGGQEVHAVENTQPQEFKGVKVYASNPQSETQPGSIRNLMVESKVQVRSGPQL